jgi:hypothetical protein
MQYLELFKSFVEVLPSSVVLVFLFKEKLH